VVVVQDFGLVELVLLVQQERAVVEQVLSMVPTLMVEMAQQILAVVAVVLSMLALA
jgi:hypothetical protein